jgi:glycerophosphoryl diester phosphodiesterase
MQVEWDLPVGISPKTVIADHSMEDLVEHWNDQWHHLQIVVHRGLYSFGDGRHENSTSAFEAAFNAGYHTIEIDVVSTKDGNYVINHDFSLDRTTVLGGPINAYTLNEIRRTPIVIRTPVAGEYRGQTTATTDKLRPVFQELRAAILLDPHCSFFLDLREGDAAPFLAELSWHEDLCKKCANIVYWFQEKNGGELIDKIEKEGPHPEWAERVGIVSMIYPEQLSEIADHYDLGKESIEDLCVAGMAYAQSFAYSARGKQLKMLAWQMMLPNITEAERPLTLAEYDDPSNVQLMKAAQAITILAQSIKNDQGIKEAHPYARIGTGTRSYNFSSVVDGDRQYYSEDLFTGDPRKWPKGFQGELKRACATPGVATRDGLSGYTISDRPEDDVVLAPCCQLSNGQSVDFKNPILDLDQ